MRYFITGATGFIGGHIARLLRGSGHEVVALVRTPAKAKLLAELGVELAPGDITDKASMQKPMADVDGVFHIAAWYEIGARDNSLAYPSNVEGTRNVLETMRDLKIPKGVYTSSLAVFSDTGGEIPDENYRFTGQHLSEYDRTKWAAHYEVAEPMQRQGLPLVIVHPGLVYGPGDHSAVRAAFVQYLQRRLPMLPLKSAYCWSHVEDCAHGHILAMEKGIPGQNYIMCGPRYTIVEAMAIAEKITGIPAPKLRIAPAILKALSVIAGLFDRFIRLPPTYTAEGLRITAGVTYLGTDAKARRELGFSTRPLEDGLRELLAHEQKLLTLGQR